MALKERIIGPETGTITDLNTSSQLVRQFGGGYQALNNSSSGYDGVFYTDHFHAHGGGISGQDGSTSYSNWPSQWVNENYNPIRHNPGNAVPSVAWMSTELFARARPDSPIFDMPRMIGELKDLPGMVKNVGSRFLNQGLPYAVGHANLSYQFGWKPLFEDAIRLTHFQDAVQKRFDELKAFGEVKKGTRRVSLYSNTSSNSYTDDMDYWHMTVSNLKIDRVWGYTRWTTTSTFPQLDRDLWALAQKSALAYDPNTGITGKGAWNLIPWTWMSDWFLNVGSYLEACRNTDDFNCTTGMICHTTIETASARSTGDRYGHHYGDVSPLSYNRIEKRRFAADPPSITAQIPILGDGQLGILSSLWSTRHR